MSVTSDAGRLGAARKQSRQPNAEQGSQLGPRHRRRRFDGAKLRRQPCEIGMLAQRRQARFDVGGSLDRLRRFKRLDGAGRVALLLEQVRVLDAGRRSV